MCAQLDNVEIKFIGEPQYSGHFGPPRPMRWEVKWVHPTDSEKRSELENFLKNGWEPFAAFSAQNMDYTPVIVLRRWITK